MKKTSILKTGISLLALLCTIQLQAQRPSELRKKAAEEKTAMEHFDEDENDFTILKAPEKWKGESAVILAQKIYYSYLKVSSNQLQVEELIRRRIILQDKSAVETFSEFYFKDGQEVGMRITKKDGQVIEPDFSKAVEINTPVPGVFRSYTYNSRAYKKLAIPNLETGDILDYFQKTTDSYYLYVKEESFPPFISTLSATYPILMQKLQFRIDKNFHINFSSYNGAPELAEGGAGENIRGKVKEDVRTFELTDRDRERYDDEFWDYQYLHEPFLKFQVYYVPKNRLGQVDYFISTDGEVKKNVSEEEIQSLVNREIYSDKYFGSAYAKEILGYLGRYHKDITDPLEVAKLTFYYLRYKIMTGYYLNYDGTMNYSVDNLVYAKDLRFLSTFLHVLEKRKIKAEVVAAVPRHLGPLENILLPDELKYVLRINDAYFVFPFSNFSTFDYVDSSLEGVEGIAFTPMRNTKAIQSNRVTIPVTGDRSNYMNTEVELTLEGDMDKVKVKRINEAGGNQKNRYSVLPLYNTGYIIDDKKKFEPNYKEPVPRGNKVRIEEENRKKTEAFDEREKKKIEAFKSNVESDFDNVESFDDYKLISDGRWDEAPVLKYEEYFTLSQLVNPAGKNYILDIGKLIGKQLELEEKELKRKTNAHMVSARSFRNKVTIMLPEGYRAEGLESLNVHIDNEHGAFIAKVTAEEGKIMLETDKRYKKAMVKAENWEDMVAFLEAAYDFTQKKVILKKF